ncbi:PEGA domain-containing protein [candidate division KSB1 bacterium]|nr:PEGA domain-containing protein [candidate division KSB1 bacterium]MBL7092823.1 PEGA domain-containing protein [candidate division KSB1 bacterium]
MNTGREVVWLGIVLLLLMGWACSKAPLPTEKEVENVELEKDFSKVVISATDYGGQTLDSADVYWDGVSIGFTPLTKENVEPGIHSLRLQKQGFELYTESIAVDRSQSIYIEALLKNLSLNKGQLFITVDRDSVATVLSNNSNEIVDQFYEREKKYVLDPGGYFLRAERQGYRLFLKAIEVKTDSIVVQNIQLEKLENTELPDVVLAVADTGFIGQPVVVTWESNNAERLEIDFIENPGLRGKREIQFQTSGKKYIRATAHNNAGCLGILDSVFISNPVENPLLPPTIELGINPKKIKVTEAAAIKWESVNATSVSVDYVSNAGLDGAWQVSFSFPGTYEIKAYAYGPGGTAVDTDTLIVEAADNPTVDPPLITKFLVTPDSIEGGETAILQWEVSGEQVKIILDQGIGEVGAIGNNNVSPAVNTSYTLYATNSGGIVYKTVNLKVSHKEDPTIDQPFIKTFSVTPDSILLGETAVLHWEVTGENVKVMVDQNIGEVGLAGNQNVTPDINTIYTLSASNGGGMVSASVALKVGTEDDPVVKPPALEFTVDPKIAEFGAPISVSWNSNGYQVIMDQGIGLRGSSGTEDVYFANPGLKIFTAVAYGTNQTTTTKTDSVYINEPTAPELPIIFLAVVDSAEVGQPAQIEWHSQNADRVDVDYVQMPGLNGKTEVVFQSEGLREITATAYNQAGQVSVTKPIQVVNTEIQPQVVPIFITSAAKVAASHTDIPQVETNAGQAEVVQGGWYDVSANVWYDSGDSQENESFFIVLKDNNGNNYYPQDGNAGLYKVVPDDPGAPHVTERNAGLFYLNPGLVTVELHHYATISQDYPQFINDGDFTGAESVHVTGFMLEYKQP